MCSKWLTETIYTVLKALIYIRIFPQGKHKQFIEFNIKQVAGILKTKDKCVYKNQRTLIDTVSENKILVKQKQINFCHLQMKRYQKINLEHKSEFHRGIKHYFRVEFQSMFCKKTNSSEEQMFYYEEVLNSVLQLFLFFKLL